jgi:predicted permease
MKNDVRFALRMILSNAWFSAAIVITLALGIGVNTTVFTLVNAVLFKPVALPGGERLVVVGNQNLTETNSRFGMSYPDFIDFRAQNNSFEGFEAIMQGQAIFSETGNPPGRHRMGRISRGMFEIVHTPPVLGRGFTVADDKPGAENVAIIGYRVWQNRYGSSRDVVGRVVRLNGQPTTIVGVMPEGFKFPSGQEIWVPLVPTEVLHKRGDRPLQVIGVLRPGVSHEQAGADLALIAKRLAGSYPDSNKNIGATVQTFHRAFNGGPIRTIFLLMLGAVGFVLLIACANVANMMLSRALARRREISVRMAMGASRWQLIRQLLIESVLLSVLGGVLGLGLALSGVHYFDLATLEVRPYWIEFNMNYVVFGYFAAISILSGLLFGLVPALRASRVDLNVELKDGARTAGNVRGGRLAGGLVVFQFALTVVLLSGAGLMMRSFFKAQTLNEFRAGRADLRRPRRTARRQRRTVCRSGRADAILRRTAAARGRAARRYARGHCVLAAWHRGGRSPHRDRRKAHGRRLAGTPGHDDRVFARLPFHDRLAGPGPGEISTSRTASPGVKHLSSRASSPPSIGRISRLWESVSGSSTAKSRKSRARGSRSSA